MRIESKESRKQKSENWWDIMRSNFLASSSRLMPAMQTEITECLPHVTIGRILSVRSDTYLIPRKHFLLIILMTIRPNLCQRVWLLWSYFAFWYPMPSFVRWSIFMNLWSCDLWPLLEAKAVRTQGHDHWWARYLRRAVEDSCYIFSWKQLLMQLDSPPSHPASVYCQIELALSLE